MATIKDLVNAAATDNFSDNFDLNTDLAVIQPTNTGVRLFDVVSNYSWTTDQGLKRNPENVPYIELIEYIQNASAIDASIKYWLASRTLQSSDKSNPYFGLYVASPTGYAYRFPWYDTYNHAISQAWGENKGPIGEAIDRYIVPIQKVLNPSAGIESARAWEGSQLASYTCSFVLLNTFSQTDIVKNITLIKQLITANLQNRTSSTVTEPPSIYTVNIPGIRYCPAAVIANLNVENIGTLNRYNKIIIPDAYKVSIQIQELVAESVGIYEGTFSDESKISVITNTGAVRDATNTFNNAVDSTTRFVKDATGLA